MKEKKKTTLKGKPDTRTDATGTGTNADTGTDCICLELTKKKITNKSLFPPLLNTGVQRTISYFTVNVFHSCIGNMSVNLIFQSNFSLLYV